MDLMTWPGWMGPVFATGFTLAGALVIYFLGRFRESRLQFNTEKRAGYRLIRGKRMSEPRVVNMADAGQRGTRSDIRRSFRVQRGHRGFEPRTS